MIIKKTLDHYAVTLNKPWVHDRSQTVGASEVGQCCRKIYWIKSEGDLIHGVKRDSEYTDNYGARLRGTMMENHFWEPALRARFGNRLLFAGAEQKTFVNGFLSATPDGMIVNLTEEEQQEIGVRTNCILVESKTADPRTNLTAPKQAHVYQTQVQMGLVRDNTPYQPTHSILSYTDASFWSEVKEFVIVFDERVYETAKQRAMLIMTATDVSEVKPEGWIAGGYECRYCPFTKACGIERRNLPFQDQPVDEQFKAEIVYLAKNLKVSEDARDACERLLRELQDAIKTRLREKGVRKIPGVLTWSNVKGRPSYDNKAIREAAVEAGIDLDHFQTTGEPTDRLTILIGPSEDEPMPDPATAAA